MHCARHIAACIVAVAKISGPANGGNQRERSHRVDRVQESRSPKGAGQFAARFSFRRLPLWQPNIPRNPSAACRLGQFEVEQTLLTAYFSLVMGRNGDPVHATIQRVF